MLEIDAADCFCLIVAIEQSNIQKATRIFHNRSDSLMDKT